MPHEIEPIRIKRKIEFVYLSYDTFHCVFNVLDLRGKNGGVRLANLNGNNGKALLGKLRELWKVVVHFLFVPCRSGNTENDRILFPQSLASVGQNDLQMALAISIIKILPVW